MAASAVAPRQEIEALIEEGRPFSMIEDRIEAMPLPQSQRDALWLLAFAEQERPTLRHKAEFAALADCLALS